VGPRVKRFGYKDTPAWLSSLPYSNRKARRGEIIKKRPSANFRGGRKPKMKEEKEGGTLQPQLPSRGKGEKKRRGGKELVSVLDEKERTKKGRD